MMGRPIQVFAVACALTVGALSALKAEAPMTPAEIKEICDAAAKRYKTLDVAKTVPKGTVVVFMYKYRYCPFDLTIKAGTTVRWVNVDKRTSHSVWFKAQGKKESERMFPEEFHEERFDTPGKYPYICGPHFERQNMRGVITVTG